MLPQITLYFLLTDDERSSRVQKQRFVQAKDKEEGASISPGPTKASLQTRVSKDAILAPIPKFMTSQLTSWLQAVVACVTQHFRIFRRFVC